MSDPATIAIYQRRAPDYARMTAREGTSPHVARFLDGLAPRSRLLDLGCGPGHAAAAMAAAGHVVEAWDAAPAMVAMAARQPGVTARLAAFEALDDKAAWEGIWANFSLLHAPRSALPGLLDRIARALVPGGIFHLGMKTGQGEGRDELGRFYAYWSEDELTCLLAARGLGVFHRHAGRDAGLSGEEAPWVMLLARKTAGGEEAGTEEAGTEEAGTQETGT